MENTKALSMPGTKSHVLTTFDDKIMLYDARKGPVTKQIMEKTWLVDLKKRHNALGASAKGNREAYDKLIDSSRSPLYKDILRESAKQAKRIENAGYVNPENILRGSKPLGSAGQFLDTAFEIVRRINFLQKIAGKSYLLSRFQARNVVNVESKDDLNFRGFTHNELLEGQPEISDNTVPDPVKPVFGFFEKQIFADSFRYEFGLRERKDSQFDIVERVVRQIPGVMEKMVNDKLIAIFNAKTSAGDVPDWDVDSDANGIFDNDAGQAIEDSENLIEDFDGPRVLIINRKGIRLYKRNVQGRNVTSVDSAQPDTGRSGPVPFSDHITYYIDNALTDNTYLLIAKDHYVDLYEGPKINVAYKNELTPAGIEGTINFHFNGAKLKLDSASDKRNGLT